MAERGRRREHPQQGYFSTSQAAEILGVVTGTVTNMIKDGRLEGGRYLTQADEVRWEATEQSVLNEAERRGRPAHLGEIEEAFRIEAAEKTVQIIESLTNEVQTQGKAQIEEIQINRKTFLEAAGDVLGAISSQDEKVDEAIGVLKEMAEREKRYQAEAIQIMKDFRKMREEDIGIMRNVRDLLQGAKDDAAEQRKSREEAKEPERRGFWRRLLDA